LGKCFEAPESFVRNITSEAAITITECTREEETMLEAEVEKTLDNLLKAGALKIVPVYMFR